MPNKNNLQNKVTFLPFYSFLSLQTLQDIHKVMIELRSLQDIIRQKLMIGRGQQTSPMVYFLCDAFVVLSQKCSHTMMFMMFLCSPQGFVLI